MLTLCTTPQKCFHSGLVWRLWINLWWKTDVYSPSPVAPHEYDPGSLTSSIVPILTGRNLRTGEAEMEPAERICAVHLWVSLRQAFPHLPASGKDRPWAGLLHSQRPERCLITQPSPAVTTPAMVSPCWWDTRVPMNQPIQALSHARTPILPMTDKGHRQGHVLLLSATHGHCPPQMLMHWEASWATSPSIVPGKCFCLSFSFSWNQLQTIHTPDTMLPFVAVSNRVWGML